nr:hypothetical protein CPGR_04700 [Mycolicibacterium komanii]
MFTYTKILVALLFAGLTLLLSGCVFAVGGAITTVPLV